MREPRDGELLMEIRDLHLRRIHLRRIAAVERPE